MKLCDIMSSLIIDNSWNILASNLLESNLWERLVYWVAKWIKQIAEERWESIEQVIEDIIEEQEDVLDE
jgi:hypothetical protein